MMDSNSEDGDYQSLEQNYQCDTGQYRVTYPHGRNTKEVTWITPFKIQIYSGYLVLLVLSMITVFFYSDGL